MSDSAPWNAPLPFTQVLDEALRLSRRHWRTILVPVAIPLATAAGLMPLMQGLMYRTMSGDNAIPDLRTMFGALGGFILATLLFLVVYFWAHFALFVAAAEAAAGRTPSMSRAWLFPLRLPALGTYLLWLLAVAVGLVLCCAPGIYVWMIFGLFVPVMVLESRFGPDALRRSVALTTYNPTGAFTADPRVKVFAVGAASWLVGLALTMVVQLPMMAVQQLYMLHAMSNGADKNPGAMLANMAWLQVPSQMVGVAIQTLTQLFLAFGMALLYFDSRNRKEGTDLETAIAELGSDKVTDSDTREGAAG
jgi:hypothetical protein